MLTQLSRALVKAAARSRNGTFFPRTNPLHRAASSWREPAASKPAETFQNQGEGAALLERARFAIEYLSALDTSAETAYLEHEPCRRHPRSIYQLRYVLFAADAVGSSLEELELRQRKAPHTLPEPDAAIVHAELLKARDKLQDMKLRLHAELDKLRYPAEEVSSL